ncbi:extensin family protein [Chthonobacter albigriseus]|uniref:extensin-like domain-containing protein n=1 Tax=Chthonobacter albigriseus TaxID=1683161 RepID=UPI0015EEDFB7|nr:extensin family protein [Chthonobacter albigriseus]
MGLILRPIMSIRFVYRTALLLCVATLAGCGFFDWEEREPWRAQAEAACFARNMVRLSPLIQPVSAIEGRGICGLDRPLKVTALADGTVRIGSRSQVMSCPMTAALESWTQTVVMPAALARYGMPVVEIKSMGTYNCRSRNNIRGARLSEHAFANAFDVAGFVLADGRTVSIKKGWRGDETDRAFLREVHAGACGPFTTVLGPGSDGKHEDHLHLDLARHNAQGTMRYCRPTPQLPPPASWPPTYQVGPDTSVPMATNIPDDSWPRVLPGTLAAAQAAPVPTAPQPYPAAPQPGYDPSLLPPGEIPGSATSQPAYGGTPACPPGYVCQPVGASQQPPPALPGWNVGPQPVQGWAVQGYAPDEVGSVPYSDE